MTKTIMSIRTAFGSSSDSSLGSSLDVVAADMLKSAIMQVRLDTVLDNERDDEDAVDAATTAWVEWEELEVRCRLAQWCLRWPEVTVDRYGARHYEDPVPVMDRPGSVRVAEGGAG